MKPVSEENQTLSIDSLRSTLSKLENSCKSMSGKNSNTTLVEKRRDAIKIGLNCLQNAWHGAEFSYSVETVRSAQCTLQELLPSIHKQYEKVKEGSAQKTLLQRRIASIELALEALEEHN
ncbi:hypothetical protein [Fictibacillus fluitans]|uniref:DUF5082 domain-containing protein n=1 Tax=Fictibacillus fluitans TaxID=3058422 RepID=A0ABT8HT33_9BACL|nr:hypothetical protein [Fictibacillus sp. NE201]MDN4523933.1 hypothetical protein [Fictibacillus sp. NE201]